MKYKLLKIITKKLEPKKKNTKNKKPKQRKQPKLGRNKCSVQMARDRISEPETDA